MGAFRSGAARVDRAQPARQRPPRPARMAAASRPGAAGRTGGAGNHPGRRWPAAGDACGKSSPVDRIRNAPGKTEQHATPVDPLAGA